MLSIIGTASRADCIHSIVYCCMQNHAAHLPEAGTMQTEQRGSNTPAAAVEVVTSLPPCTPSKKVSATASQLSPVQQQAGLASGGTSASPLPSIRYGARPPPPPNPHTNPNCSCHRIAAVVCQTFDTTLMHQIVSSNVMWTWSSNGIICIQHGCC